jgi:hypothetical protein
LLQLSSKPERTTLERSALDGLIDARQEVQRASARALVSVHLHATLTHAMRTSRIVHELWHCGVCGRVRR